MAIQRLAADAEFVAQVCDDLTVPQTPATIRASQVVCSIAGPNEASPPPSGSWAGVGRNGRALDPGHYP
jgi:hypothetical protein